MNAHPPISALKPGLTLQRFSQTFVLFSSSLLFSCLNGIPAIQAQIIPDATLPVNSTVTPQGNINQINGGTQAGGNLFHSFQEFSIPTGNEAFFNNSLDIQNIFSRVTGNSISNIDGLIRANGFANLFLLNPNGIVFGSNAQLNIGGSFLASTANRINFADGTAFSTLPSETPPLLTVSVSIGLQMGVNPGKIVVQGPGNNIFQDSESKLIFRENRPIGLGVQEQTLALVSANIEVNGGNLTSKGGRIELGSVGDNSTVSLNPTNNGWDLGYSEVTDFRDIYLNASASLDASGEGAGRIHIQSRNLSLTEGSVIISFIEGNQVGQDLTIRTTETIKLSGFSLLDLPSSVGTGVNVSGSNHAGNLTIETAQLNLLDGSGIFSVTVGQGNAADITVRATEWVTLSGGYRQSSGVGIIVLYPATGDAGNLTLETAQLTLNDGAVIGSLVFGQGNAGNVSIRASKSVTLSGLDGNGGSSILQTQVGEDATGNAGNLTLETAQLTLNDGAYIASASFGQGNAGDVSIRATESVTLSGLDGNRWGSNLRTDVGSGAIGDAGNLTLETAQLTLNDGAYISSATVGQGNAGNLSIRATESVTLSGLDGGGLGSSFRTDVGSGATGDAGNVTLETAQLTLNDGAYISSETLGNGNAGNVSVFADEVTLRDGVRISVSGVGDFSPGVLRVNTDLLFLDTQSSITADTQSGSQGNIEISANSLLMRRNSNITTNATGPATGGNINITTGVLAALENSNINANSEQAQGGTVTIDAQAIFGTEFRENPTSNSDITATGADSSLSGTVSINTPEIDPTSGLVELPTTLTDVAQQIDSSCRPGQQQSEFIVTGRGGLPPNPIEAVSDEATWLDLRPGIAGVLSGANPQTSSVADALNPVLSSPTPPLVEAQGWVVNAQGKMELVAQGSEVALQNRTVPPSACLVN
ncbi:S-layer family protein [Laspinema sp. A4]|uniref:S-layer family protein n=1 Tax=Laspinema sp. D2d TaxID=2953686 RepID=UPI0021BB525A|nr:S-layer family protein [Laspinema sp. D2d]MCT7985240.1 S-layer family protein [Laspinema sp. D2d]